MKGRNILLSIVLLTSILFTTYVYAAFSAQLTIEGEAIVRSDQDIRITNISIKEQSNGAYETYNNKYNKDTTMMYVTLPSNSSIIYEVEITNKSNIDYIVKNIEKSISNENINVSITNIDIQEIIENNTIKLFSIRISNITGEEQNIDLLTTFTFIEYKTYIVKFDGDGATSGSMNDEIFINDIYKTLPENEYKRVHTVTYESNGGNSDVSSDTSIWEFSNWGNKDILEYDLDFSKVGDYYRNKNIYGNYNGYMTATINATGLTGNVDFASWNIDPPFTPGDRYKVTFNARRDTSSSLSIFFWGGTNYLQIAQTELSTGSTNTDRIDGWGYLYPDTNWNKYSVIWTLSSNGNPNVIKYLLFRVGGGNNIISICNVRFEKLEVGDYTDKENVINITNNNEVTLYAVWKPKAVILPNATKDGYTFDGWYTTSNIKVGTSGDLYVPKSDTTLYAKWIENE